MIHTCRICGQTGHNARTCSLTGDRPVKVAKEKQPKVEKHGKLYVGCLVKGSCRTSLYNKVGMVLSFTSIDGRQTWRQIRNNKPARKRHFVLCKFPGTVNAGGALERRNTDLWSLKLTHVELLED